MEFNVVITYEPGVGNSNWVFSQINSCVGTSYIISKVKSSMILLNVRDPFGFWHNLKCCLMDKDTPIHRVIPVDRVVEPLLDRVANVAKEYALKRIPADETYRVTLHGRLYTLDENKKIVKVHSIDAVKAIAQHIDRKVDLKNPNWVVYVRSIPIRRWQIVAIVSVARAYVFKNIRVGGVGNPI